MADSLSENDDIIKRRPALVNLTIRLIKEKPLGVLGGIITLGLLLTGIFADVLAPYGMNESHTGYFLIPPSLKFWFGTDNVCRDIFSRVIYGARISVIIGLTAATIATVISLILGIVSGYNRGNLDLILQRFVDAVMCVPALILMLVVISIIGAGIVQLILVLGILIGIRGCRIVRSTVISIRENAYFEAAVAIGCSTPRILIRHVLPNIMAPAIILFSTRVPMMIMAEASLSFLGFGVPPPTPTWGGMLSGSGRQYMYAAPWMITWPGLALALVVYGVNMFGDALRDILDPRLKGGVGHYDTGKPKLPKLKVNPALQRN